jgi:diguanylate cyclase (GGDEF)-like protein
LVVDDSRTIRRILRRDLEATGYRVSEAPDGEVALALCRASKPDLVLLDVDMPVLDGMATLERMQADLDLRDIPVLFLTARTSGAEAARGLGLGAEDYLKKPCDPTELLARVGAVLRQRIREQRLVSQAQELTEQSTTDALTGVANRRGLHQLLAEMDGERPLGIVLMDLDHFKVVNDTEGHVVGDTVLAVVASRLRSTCGTRATVTRWGGEEFVVTAPNCTAEALAELAEQLRACVGGDPLAVGGRNPLAVTISAGTALGNAADFDDLLNAADAAMYKAKAGGRNRVVASSRR